MPHRREHQRRDKVDINTADRNELLGVNGIGDDGADGILDDLRDPLSAS